MSKRSLAPGLTRPNRERAPHPRVELRLRSARAVLLTCLCACGDGYAELAGNWPSDSLLLLAAADAEGRVLRVDRLEPGSTRSLFGAPERSESLHLYAVPAGQLVGPEGDPIDATGGAGPVARRVMDPPANGASCARCPVVAISPPQVILSGSSCGPPAWVSVESYRVTDGGIEREGTPGVESKVRGQITLDWPGPCACESELRAGPAREPSLDCLIHPKNGYLLSSPFMDELGNVAGRLGRALFVAPAGEPADVFEDVSSNGDELGIIGTSTLSASFTVVLGSAGSEDSGRNPTLDLYEVDASSPHGMRLTHEERVVLPFPVAPSSFLSLGPSEFLMSAGRVTSGLGLNHTPTLFQCKGPPDVECVELPVETCPGEDGELGPVRLLEDGTGLSSGPHSVYLRRSGSDRWKCLGQLGSVVFEGRTYIPSRRTRGFHFDSLDDRVFFCGLSLRTGEFGPEESGSALFTATISDLEASGGPTNAEMIWFAEGESACSSSWIEGSDTLSFTFSGGTAVEVDELGSVVQVHAASDGGWTVVPELGPAPLVTFLRSAGDWQLASVGTSSFFRRHRGAGFEKIFGPLKEDEQAAKALAALDDGSFVWFHGRDVARVVEGVPDARSCDDLSLAATTFPPRDARTDDDAQLVTNDSRGTNRFAVAGVGAERTWLRIVEVDTSAILEEVTLPFEGRSLLDLQEWLPGRFILIGPDGDLFLLAEGEVIELAVEYDDPATPIVEREPPSTGYRPKYSALGGSSGVVWAGGDRRLARILAVAPGAAPRVEGYWLDRSLSRELRERTYKSEFFGEPQVTAISPSCPDRVLVGWREVQGATLSDEPDLGGSISVLSAPTESECSSESTELTLCERSSIPLDAKMSEVNEDRPRLLGFVDSGRTAVTSELFSGTEGFAESPAAVIYGAGLGRLRVRILERRD
ncbi:MAG: hypothetical protein HY791_15535 [Deltaproteobacteria bacterium]|nr:hypothetical protein [Deltaproteobacteria bacterium]